jgi:SAM-dependent methyltransferase
VNTDYSIENATTFGWGPDDPAVPQKADVLRRHVIGPAVLDVGCASGTYVDLLSARGFQATGLDAFPQFLEEARARGRRGTFVRGDAQAMPFPDKSFDTTVLFDVLEHLDDQAVLQEAARVTRRRIIALVPLSDPEELLRNNFVFEHHRDRTHLREYTVPELTRLFVDLGLTVRAVEPAFPANPRGLLADSLRLPSPVRWLARALLRLLKPLVTPHYSEVFLVADVPG